MPRKPAEFTTDLDFLLHIMGVRVCNCARCGIILGNREDLTKARKVHNSDQRRLLRLPNAVAGRLLGRPYCALCVRFAPVFPIPRPYLREVI